MAVALNTSTLGRASSPAVVPALDARAVRWWVKKMVRTAFALGSMVARLAVPPRDVPRVRVLTYHRFGDARRDAFCVRTEDFDRQMAWLAQHRLAISLDDLDAFLDGTRALPRNAVLVTVDDGNPCLYSRALPIAARHGIPLVAFVPAGEIVPTVREHGNDCNSPDARLTVEELAALAAGGVAIGSHALTHRSLARLPSETQRTEVERSRAVLERITGRPITAFAYPFGTRADYNDTTAAMLRAAGYRFAFTSQHGAVTAGVDSMALPRVKVEGGEGLWMFRAIVHGGMDGWRWVDRFFWRLQATP